jgi:uncharacterized protein YegP (UPF0339 family)
MSRKKRKSVFPDFFVIGTPTPKPNYFSPKPALEVFQKEDGRWYWLLRANNGDPLAVCVEGFYSRRECKKVQAEIARSMREAIIVESEE